MVFKNFRLNILLRVLVLSLLLVILFWGLVNTDWQVTPLVCAVLIIFCIFELIRYVEKTSQEFTSFLEYISHHDFSVSISNKSKGRIFADLGSACRLITDEFKRLNREKNAHYQYLEYVIEHINVALICLDAGGNVRLMNKQSVRLFRMPYMTHIKSLGRIDHRLPGTLHKLVDGERLLISIKIGGENMQLVLYATEFRLLDENFKLVSFQNIREELEQRENDSWQKLIRVLTHEIMNSVTPIIALTGVIREMLLSGDGEEIITRELTVDDKADLLNSIRTIESRSRGLLNFVQTYSSLINLPAPDFKTVDVNNLFNRIRTLMSSTLEENNIKLVIDCDLPDLTIRADPQQIEQVFINLVKNAVEALAGTDAPIITLRGFVNKHGKVMLQVIDNGAGIPADILDNIFIPFFSTKQKGSGVGLSISRQILYMNNGYLSVTTGSGEGCVFTLRFK
jgi:nitrogen fixation/metabolism regulation signal transduction histidine kinase